jgi:hypothetical protein
MTRLIAPCIALTTILIGLWACSSNDSVVLKDGRNQNEVRVIVLMPVENQTKDARVPLMLRAKISEWLRFKGYSQVLSDTPDGQFKPLNYTDEVAKERVAASQVVWEKSGADAAMYCTLQESRARTAVFYAPATVAARCELRSMKTGETLWQAQYKSTSRGFDLIHTRLKLKSEGALESALEEVVGKVMETLPYGPKLRG